MVEPEVVRQVRALRILRSEPERVVRLQAKMEAPLQALAATGNIISTIAELTFYGRDQTGREVIATGRMSINFGDYADPE